jgi:biopolymer transport protein ExbD
MGMSTTSGGGLSSEPNVIPMIDILLVLLIIFMMTITQNRKAMDIQIPKEQEAQQEQQRESDQIVLELKDDGTYAINATPVTLSQLDRAVHALYDQRPAKIMFLKTARNRRWRDVITAMDIVRGAGVQVIGFTPPDKSAAGGA